ncbi:CU044_5270 family protein [Actinocorallia populi]|uniref:CU044_5270 family protein n=1 Tax=Actinocorallia populi TaxID=2079200 RepID=UPI000D09507C|nr:CU044_5270 family protein [Actinocorallia populi]
MNSMERLRAARPAHLDTPTDPGTRTRELDHAFSQHRQTASRRSFRPVWGLGLAGAVTAAAVVASGVLFDPQAEVSTDPVVAPTASVALDARTVLLSAATQAEAQQEKTGTWWSSTSVQRHMSRVQGEPSYAVYELSETEAWTPYAPGGEQISRSQRRGFEFPSPEDEAAWKQAGSPSKVSVGAPKPVKAGSAEQASYPIDREPGKERVSRSRLVDGDKVFWLGKNVTMKELQELPGDPKRLKAWLLRSYKGHDTESSSVPMTSEAWLYRVTTGLIADMPVTPKVRGAAFRMLAELKTVQVVENVTDFEGRSGTAVTMKEKASGAVLLNRLVFDRATGRALQTDSVIVEPGGYQRTLPAGALWNAVTIVSSGWTEEAP